MTSLSWACLDTPVGIVCAGCTAAGVAQVRYGAPPTTRAQRLAGGAADADPAADALAAAARRELTEYFRGDRQVFDVPVDWTAVAGLHRQVLTVLAGSVGYGHTISYGGLARAAGLTDADQDGTLRVERGQPPAGLAARTVGTIMATNPVPVVVPCHRVVASDGLGGYSGGAGIETKRWLLILEGSLPPTLDWQPMPWPA